MYTRCIYSVNTRNDKIMKIIKKTIFEIFLLITTGNSICIIYNNNYIIVVTITGNLPDMIWYDTAAFSPWSLSVANNCRTLVPTAVVSNTRPCTILELNSGAWSLLSITVITTRAKFFLDGVLWSLTTTVSSCLAMLSL